MIKYVIIRQYKSFPCQLTCGIIALIHLIIKLYNNEILNKFDGIILQLIIIATALPLFDDFDSPLVISLAFVLIILPQLKSLAIALFLLKDNLKNIIKHFMIKNQPPNSNNEIPMKEFDIIVDNSTRTYVTVCDM